MGQANASRPGCNLSMYFIDCWWNCLLSHVIAHTPQQPAYLMHCPAVNEHAQAWLGSAPAPPLSPPGSPRTGTRSMRVCHALPLCQWSAAGSTVVGHSSSSRRCAPLSAKEGAGGQGRVWAAAAEQAGDHQGSPGVRRAMGASGSSAACGSSCGDSSSKWRRQPTRGAGAVALVPLLHQLGPHLQAGSRSKPEWVGRRWLRAQCMGASLMAPRSLHGTAAWQPPGRWR